MTTKPLEHTDLCLVLVQVPKYFCVRPKIHLQIVPVTNILCQSKRWFEFSKIGFCASTKFFEEALNAVKFVDWLKIFGPAQNVLEPVKGQVISLLVRSCSTLGLLHIYSGRLEVIVANVCYVWRLFTVRMRMIKSVKVFAFSFWKLIMIFLKMAS